MSRKNTPKLGKSHEAAWGRWLATITDSFPTSRDANAFAEVYELAAKHMEAKSFEERASYLELAARQQSENELADASRR